MVGGDQEVNDDRERWEVWEAMVLNKKVFKCKLH